RAACPQRVLACLLEFGVDFELINVDLDSNEHKQPEFLQKQKALVDQWLEVEAHHFNDMVYTIVLQKLVIPKMGGKPDLALVQNCEKKLEKVFDIYEQQLSKNRYLAGDCFTLADLSHLPGIRYLINEAELGHMVKGKKNVNSWWCDISNRVAWKKVMQLME
ncbi:Glutathione S-transferase/chloride channel, C-terminal, partial [Cynara cardunculus var. scolymus]